MDRCSVESPSLGAPPNTGGAGLVAADRAGRAIVTGRTGNHRLRGVGGSCRGLPGLARRGPAGNRDQGDRLGPGQPVRERPLGEVVMTDRH